MISFTCCPLVWCLCFSTAVLHTENTSGREGPQWDFSLIRLQDVVPLNCSGTSGEKSSNPWGPPALLRAAGILAVSMKKQTPLFTLGNKPIVGIVEKLNVLAA